VEMCRCANVNEVHTWALSFMPQASGFLLNA
jgi:hypothetical protein